MTSFLAFTIVALVFVWMDTLAAILSGIAITWTILLIGQDKKVFDALTLISAISSVVILSAMIVISAYRVATFFLSSLVP